VSAVNRFARSRSGLPLRSGRPPKTNFKNIKNSVAGVFHRKPAGQAQISLEKKLAPCFLTKNKQKKQYSVSQNTGWSQKRKC